MIIGTLGAEPAARSGLFLSSNPTGSPIPVRFGEIRSVLDLVELMRTFSVRVLHVHNSALAALELPGYARVLRGGEKPRPHPFFAKPGVSHQSPAPAVRWSDWEVMFGAYQADGCPFGGAKDARELLQAHILFASAVRSPYGKGQPWWFRHSAMKTGWGLMHHERLHSRRVRELLELRNFEPVDIGGQLPGVQIQVPWGNSARAYRRAGARRFVHAYDINGQRLAAASRLQVGFGECIRGAPPISDPGYHWLRSILVEPDAPFGMMEGATWNTTPMVQMAAHLGLAPDLDKPVWHWPTHAPYFEPFYKIMRDARNTLIALQNEAYSRPAATLALSALKRCYLLPFGRLRSENLQGDTYYRPSWYDQLIGQELARQYLRIQQLVKARIPILAVRFDTLIVESDESDPAVAVKGVLEVSQQLGKYKHLGSGSTAEALEVLYHRAGEADVRRLVNWLQPQPTGVLVPQRSRSDGRPAPTAKPTGEVVKLTVRVPYSLRRQLHEQAATAGLSLNKYMLEKLQHLES